MGMGASHIYNVNQAWPSLFSGVQLVRLKQKSATKGWTCYSYPVTFIGKSRNFKLSWEKQPPPRSGRASCSSRWQSLLGTRRT